MTFKELIFLLIPTKVEKYIKLKRNQKKRFSDDSKSGIMIKSTAISEDAVLNGTAEIDENVYIGSYVCIGKHTYIHTRTEILSASIGNFCSIGSNCHIGMFEHPVDNISTSSRLYLKILDDKEYYNDIPSPVIIGNDVWICSNSTILGGVKVGNGAVIGAWQS